MARDGGDGQDFCTLASHLTVPRAVTATVAAIVTVAVASTLTVAAAPVEPVAVLLCDDIVSARSTDAPIHSQRAERPSLLRRGRRQRTASDQVERNAVRSAQRTRQVGHFCTALHLNQVQSSSGVDMFEDGRYRINCGADWRFRPSRPASFLVHGKSTASHCSQAVSMTDFSGPAACP